MTEPTDQLMTEDSPSVRPAGRRRWLTVGGKALISLALVLLVASKVDVLDALKRIGDANLGYVTAAFGMLILQTLAVTLRWSVIVRLFGRRIPFIPAVKVIYIGLLANQGLPSFVAGDALRVYWLRKLGSALDVAVRVTVVDRVAALVVLVLMLLLGLPSLLSLSDDAPISLGLWMVGGGGLAGSILAFVLDRLPTPLYRIRAFAAVASISLDIRNIAGTRGPGLVILALSLIGHLLTAAFLWLLGRGMGLALTPIEALILMPPVILISMLPFSVAGWGVRESVMITGMSLFHVDPEAALAVSLLFGIVSLVHGLLGLPAFFLTKLDDRQQTCGANT